jgi:outer membrane protein TolC
MLTPNPLINRENHMTVHDRKIQKRRTHALPTLTILTAALFLAGCTVTPKMATQEEVRERVKTDTERMYVNQSPISGPVSLEEAIARTLKYNLDYRLKKMESALALGLTDYASYETLPRLLANAGYRTRSTQSGGTSVGILDGVQSLRPSTSEERSHSLAGAEFSWNLLDFGVSYYRARQQSDQFLIAEERRRKVVQNMVQDVRASYWRALGAQRLSAQTKDILDRAQLALARSREAETQRVISPVQALNYQRALLDAISFLNQRRQDLEFASHELAALMNVEPGVAFTVAETSEARLPAPPNDVRKLEELALIQRPELREEDFKKRISADETRKQLLGILPGISFDAGLQYDSNQLLNSNRWAQGGVRISWNLLQLVALPSLKATQEQQVRTDEARRMALSMAVMTQLRVGVERYRLAVEDFRLADTAAQVDKRMADYTRAAVTARLESELEAIRTQARAVLGSFQRANTYASAQIAFGRLYNTLGFDPLPDDFDGNDLALLTERVRGHLRATEQDTLKMTSNLFGHAPSVSVRLVGVENPVLNVRMKAQISELLARNQVEVDASNGIPVTFTLARESKDSLENAKWSIKLADSSGKVKGEAWHASMLPAQARNTAYEATLVAALTSKLPQLKNWLAELAQETQQ